MPETSRREEPFEKQHIVRRKCSWCGKDLGTAGYMSSEEGEVSGGMCTECRERETKKLLEGKENNKKQYPVIKECMRCHIQLDAGFTSDKPNQISHGYCSTCALIATEKIREETRQVLANNKKNNKEEPSEEQHILRRVCAWCGKELGAPIVGSQVEGETSGICEDCAKKVAEEGKKYLQDKKEGSN